MYITRSSLIGVLIPFHSDGADPPSGPSQFKILKVAMLQPTLPLDPPTCLFIQTELCKRGTLHTWLHETCEEESQIKSQVLSFFKQVRILTFCFCVT